MTASPQRAAERTEDAAGRAAANPWVARVARTGIAARGVVYLLVALLVTLVAAGRGGPEADRRGAVETVAVQPFGRVLLVLLCAGLVAHVAWQALRALGPRPEQDAKAALKRAAAVGIAALYLALLATTVGVLAGSRQQSSAAEQQEWTARLLEAPAGRLLVGLAGAALIVAAGVLVRTGLKHRFEPRFDTSRLQRRSRRSVAVLGTAGQCARAAAFALVGGFVVKAAADHDPSRSRGLDGALRTLTGKPYGSAALALLALGLVAYGLYSFAEARWQDNLTE